jgi:ferritin
MISKKIEDALNQQINAEFHSAYLYLSMSAYFLSLNLNGFSHWMKIQSQEEVMHAIKVFNFVNERDGRVILQPIQSVTVEWDLPLATFEEAYNHEQKMTALINNITSLAIEEKDHATQVFLQWFINEQVEEEANAITIVKTLKLIGNSTDSLFYYDRELAKRTVPPMPTTGQQNSNS